MKIVLDFTLTKGADPETVANAIFDFLCAVGEDSAAAQTVDEGVSSFEGWDTVED